MSTIRRVYLYLSSFVGLSLAVAGFINLSNLIVQFGVSAFNGDQASATAPALAFLIIGAVTWRFFWRTLQGEADAALAERAAGMRKLFLYGTMTIALVLTLVLAQNVISELLRRLFDGELSSFNSWTQISTGALMALLWRYHEGIADREQAQAAGTRGADLRRAYWFLLSAFGALMMIAGLGTFFTGLFSHLGGVAPFSFGSSDTSWVETLLLALVQVVVGGVAVWMFWLPSQRAAEAGDESERASRARALLIHITLFVLSISVLNAAQQLLTDVLGRLLLGSSPLSFGINLFVVSSAGALGALVVGGLLGWYFFNKVRPTLVSPRLSEYIFSAVAFFIALAGVLDLITSLFLVLGGSVPSNFSSIIVRVVPPLLIGGGVWRWRWTVLEQDARSGGNEARLYVWRSVYLYVFQFVGVVFTLIGGTSLLQAILAALLGSPLSGNVFSAMAMPLAQLLVGLGLIIYMGRTLSSDRVVVSMSLDEIMQYTIGDGLPTWAIGSLVIALLVVILAFGFSLFGIAFSSVGF